MYLQYHTNTFSVPSNDVLFTEENIVSVFNKLSNVATGYMFRNFLNSLLHCKELPTKWDKFYFFLSEPREGYIEDFKNLLLADVKSEEHLDKEFSDDLFKSIYFYSMTFKYKK
jgi:hypothetical protein